MSSIEEKETASRSQPCGSPESSPVTAEPSAAFTPGPWAVSATDDFLVVKGRQKIAATFPITEANPEASDDIERANAHLISAAPDLLEALKDCLACWPHDFNSHGEELAEAKARAAIAKAEGK